MVRNQCMDWRRRGTQSIDSVFVVVSEESDDETTSWLGFEEVVPGSGLDYMSPEEILMQWESEQVFA